MPRGKTLSAGDSINFDLAYSHAGQETCYVKCGDSVCVSLTEVTDLGATDPATGQALFRLSWTQLGQSDSPSLCLGWPDRSRDVSPYFLGHPDRIGPKGVVTMLVDIA